MFIKAIPILPVFEMLATISFYESKLGFTAINMGSWGIVKRANVEIQLNLIAKNNPFNANSCCIYTINIEDYYAELSSKELVFPAGRLTIKQGGIAEFFIQDNNGNTLFFREIN